MLNSSFILCRRAISLRAVSTASVLVLANGGGVRAASKGILAFKLNGKVEALVEHFRERMRWIESDRCQYRHHFTDEIIPDPFALRFVPGGATQKADAFGCQCRQDDVVEMLILLGDDRVGLGRYQAISLLRRFAVGGRARGMRLDLFLETGHADFEKFIQIAGDDTQEAQTFKQGYTLVFRLGQNASVERQKTQLAVEIILGRKAGFLLGMSHRASSM